MLLMAECILFVNIKRTRTADILPLFSTEIIRRIVDLYLSGEGPRAISRTVCVNHGGVCIIRKYQTYAYGAYSPFNQGGRGNPSKLPDNVIKSIELFKLMKLSMFGREILERLLNDGEKLTGFIDGNKGIKNKLCMSYK